MICSGLAYPQSAIISICAPPHITTSASRIRNQTRDFMSDDLK